MLTGLDSSQANTPLCFDISSLAGLRQQEPHWHKPAPRAPHYTLLLLEAVRETRSLVLSAEQAPNELYFSRPGEAVLLAGPAGIQGQVLRFTDEFVGLAGADRELLLFPLFQRATTGPVRVPAAEAVELALLLDSMKRQAAGDPLLRDDLLRSYLKTLLLHCTRFSQQQHGGAGPLVPPGLFGRFQQLLEAHFTRWKSVAEYAAQLSVTANHLSVSIKKETGRPASEHIRRRIVQEAKRLVALGDVPLKEVAYQLGFEDVSHFSKLFKRCAGTTFSDFKGQVRAQYHCPALNLMAA
jgi:AraC family transcriptional regulator, transcriptional activator of pobA